MRGGDIDRRLKIQRKVITQNGFGDEIVAWETVATVWAQKVEARGDERFAAQQFLGHAVKTFRIRWSDTVKEITSEHRLVLDGRAHDITDVREVGRREGLEIDCTVRSEEPVDA